MLPTVILMQPLGKWPLMKVKFSRRESIAFKAIHFSVSHSLNIRHLSRDRNKKCLFAVWFKTRR